MDMKQVLLSELLHLESAESILPLQLLSIQSSHTSLTPGLIDASLSLQSFSDGV